MLRTSHFASQLAAARTGLGIVIAAEPYASEALVSVAHAKSLDAGCMAKVHRPPFPKSYPGGAVVSVKPAALAKFAGHYQGEASIELKVKDGQLHAILEGQELALLPIGPDRFRLAVSPHTRITFRKSKGAISGFEMEDGGAPPETYRLVR